MMRRSKLAGLLLSALAAAPLATRADTVASLLGNFTINQYCGIELTDEAVRLHYVVVFGQLPALRELHLADLNHDGVTSQAERDAYVRRLAPGLASQLKVAIDGVAVPLHVTHWTSSLPTEQGGFSLRLDADFAGALPARGLADRRTLSFTNQNYDGRIGWHEIAVQASPGLQVFDTNAYGSSLTAGLTEALKALPAGGPLDERAVHLSFTRGAAPAGAQLLAPRSRALLAETRPQPQAASNDESAWLQRRTRALVNLISTPQVAPRILITALLAALLLGALHAFSPGHGKTIVGAYLIGSRGTPKHAAFLGFTVTVTHTLGVFALGFATLFASRFFVPERLLPILSLVSGLLVLGMGMILLAQRWRGARIALSGRIQPGPGHAHHDHEHGHDHDHSHHHHHHHGDGHADQGALMHSHGGSVHSHLPPGMDGTDVTWRSLLALGISGGLIPCPSAMVLLLAAVALNKTGMGLLLVLAFSVGLAATLTGVGLAFLYARDRFPRPSAAARWPHLLPVLSAGMITLVGLGLCVAALQSARF